MNSVIEKIRTREEVTSCIRQFLKDRGYHEADVPVLVPSLIPESYLEPFKTTITGSNPTQTSPVRGGKEGLSSKSAYLTASPEAFLKRLLVEGSGNIYYLGKAFRNGEPFGPLHNHEFAILEWYHVGYDYIELMKEIEEMIYRVGKDMIKNIDLTPPWEYMTIDEATKRFVPNPTLPRPPRYAKRCGQASPNRGGKEEQNSCLPYQGRIKEGFAAQFEKDYVQYIEPNLGTRGKPTFITDFPAWQSPLAKTRNNKHETINKFVYSLPFNVSKNDIVAERFELYINGIELVNGWTELTDSKQQTINFKQEQEERKKNGKSPTPTDTGFLEALKKGMPECAGAAMGVDRLIMVLTGAQTLEEVILFPNLKLFT